jgi:hypothetical protein
MNKRNALIRDRQLEQEAKTMPKQHFHSFISDDGYTCVNCHRFFGPGCMALREALTGELWCAPRKDCTAVLDNLYSKPKEFRKAEAQKIMALLDSMW